jgi:hypothetical protein
MENGHPHGDHDQYVNEPAGDVESQAAHPEQQE